MTAIPDHYAALGIDPAADPEVIAAAYRALAKKYHPDTGATTGTASAERFEQVQRAYEVLRSPESRRRYDLDLLAQAERDLEEHLARKRRALPGAGGTAAGITRPDLGAIRPEPASARPRGRGPSVPQHTGGRRSAAPFLIPAALLLVLLGAAAWLFLPDQRGMQSSTIVGTAAPSAEMPAPTPAAPAAPNSADGVPAGSAGSAAQAALETAAVKADAEPAAAPPATDTAAAAPPEGEPGQTPVFGTSDPGEADAGTATTTAAMPVPVPPVPTPKPRPAKPNTATAKPPASKPPATKPPAAKPPAAPRLQAEAASAYTLTIFERKRRGGIRSRQADMLFATRGSCVEFGVRAVLRRMEARNMNPRRQRIWYECEPAF